MKLQTEGKLSLTEEDGEANNLLMTDPGLWRKMLKCQVWTLDLVRAEVVQSYGESRS